MIRNIFSPFSSVDHVCVPRRRGGQESDQGAPARRGGHQVRDPADASGLPHVRAAALPGVQHDPEVAAEGDLEL